MDREELLRIIKKTVKTGRTSLDLKRRRIAEIPPEIGRLRNLQELDLWGNQLASLPPDIGQLTNLRNLELRDNQLTSLPPEIGQLTNLRRLGASGNRLTSLPPDIGAPTNLQRLDASGNRLTSLPPEIGALTNLQWLHLGDNQLTSLPPEIGQLAKLRSLNLQGNQLTFLPPTIGALANLQRLDASGNQLTSLPPEIGQLVSLEELCLGAIWRTRYAPVAMASITGLQQSLYRNRLTSLPRDIAELAELRKLYLDNNQLTSLPPQIGFLARLKVLDLRNNQLHLLPESILELSLDFNTKELQDQLVISGRISVFGNPLERPPMEIIEQGKEAVRRYFASLRGETRVLNEVKILLVGDGGAGKTSLVNRLLRDEFDPNESKTQGVNIDDWTVPTSDAKICAHIWDFGGQVIMHSTHQFFLSRRSLYVLVLDGRKEEDAEYWLKHIESFGGDSPILVVLNKMDENPGFDVNRRFLQSKYMGIVGFFRISCRTGKGIGSLKEALIDSLPKVEITSTTWPENWFRIKRQLETMETSFISCDEYATMCAAEAIPEEGEQDTLVKFLHDLGVVVHFHDFDLRDTHVLDPRWLTTAVYRIINSKILAEKKGILKLSSLAGILSSNDAGFVYPTEKHLFILNIMEKFELCFRIDRDRILIPDLLEVQEPAIEFDYGSSLRFRIDYDFLPRSILPRFIVKKHTDIKGDLRWRTGVVLESEAFAATAVVRADEAAKRIYIDVAGAQRRDYLTVLRSVFWEINKGFQKLQYTERIPLPDDPEVTVSYDHLLRLEKEGIEEFLPERAKRRYRVKELLGTVYVERKLTADDLFVMLQQVVKDTDAEKAIVEKANNIIMLQPNFAGLGVDLRALVDRLMKWRKGRAGRPKTGDSA